MKEQLFSISVGIESHLLHSVKHQTADTINMVRRISTDIYTNVVIISAGVKRYSVIRVVWLIKKLDQGLINKARQVTKT